MLLPWYLKPGCSTSYSQRYVPGREGARIGILINAEPRPAAGGRVEGRVGEADHAAVGRGQILHGLEREHGAIGVGPDVFAPVARARHVGGVED